MPAGDARFVSLAEIIRSRPPASETLPVRAQLPERDAPQPAVRETSSPAPAIAPPAARAPAGPSESGAAIREARMFRAALADAFAALTVELVCDFAAAVLGRELRLAPPDIEQLARQIIAERRADEPLSLRVCPADALVACDLPVVSDPELQPGDAVLVCRNGDIDARLAVRLAQVLESAS